MKDKTAVILDKSVCYPEMGGQVGDTGSITVGTEVYHIVDTQKNGDTTLHYLKTAAMLRLKVQMLKFLTILKEEIISAAITLQLTYFTQP